MPLFTAISGRHVSSLRPLILIVFLVTTLIHPATGSVQFEIDSGKKICFGTYALVKSVITSNFDLLDDEGSPESFSAHFSDPAGKVVWSSDYGASEGNFRWEGEGRYELCFDNKDTTDDGVGGDYHVGFALRTVPIVQDPAGAAGEKNSMTSQLISSMSQLLDQLEDISDHQTYMRARESTHRELSENIFARVFRWTLLEGIVLLFVAGGQVMYLRKFFEKKRVL